MHLISTSVGPARETREGGERGVQGRIEGGERGLEGRIEDRTVLGDKEVKIGGMTSKTRISEGEWRNTRGER